MEMKPHHWHDEFRVRETNPEKLKKIFKEVLLESQLTILKVKTCYYEGGGNGCTVCFFLAESHLILTPYPESDVTICEISCCNLEKFSRFLAIVESRGFRI